MLVVTSKQRVELWADCVRNQRHSRLHSYTAGLQERRRHGTSILTRVDVVVTTFDVLRSKEVCVPETVSSIEALSGRMKHLDTTFFDDDASNSDHESEENDAFEGKENRNHSREWLKPRKNTQHKIMYDLCECYLSMLSIYAIADMLSCISLLCRFCFT